MKKIVAVLLIAVMALSLAACAKENASADPIVGTWRINTDATLAELEQSYRAAFQAAVEKGYDLTLTLNADGTGMMTVTARGQTNTGSITYTAEDGKLVLKLSGRTDKRTYRIEGDRMYLYQNSEAMVLDRQ